MNHNEMTKKIKITILLTDNETKIILNKDKKNLQRNINTIKNIIFNRLIY